MTNPEIYEMDLTSKEERTAAIGGTRQMMHEDEFAALAGVLVASGAVSKADMADALDALIEKLVAKARGRLEADFAVYPIEVFDRVRALAAYTSSLRQAERD